MNNSHPYRRMRAVFLAIVIVVAAVSTVSAPAFGAQTVLDNNGDTSFFTPTPRPLANFPAFESLVPMPLNINPFNRNRVQQNCVVQAVKKAAPIKGAKGVFAGKLVVMDNSTGTFETVVLASGKFKTNSDGLAVFSYDIATDLFAKGFKSGSISAWSYARVEFAKRKATYGLLHCSVTARK